MSNIAPAQINRGAFAVNRGNKTPEPMNRRQDPRAQNSFAPGNRQRIAHVCGFFSGPRQLPGACPVPRGRAAGHCRPRVLLGGNHGAAHGKVGLINIILAGFVGVDFQRLEIALGENSIVKPSGFFKIPHGAALLMPSGMLQ